MAAGDPVAEPRPGDTTEPGAERRPGETRDPAEPLRQARRYDTPLAWVNAIDLAAYRRIRQLAHDPDRVRAVRRFSTLGEYAGIWFAIGAAGMVVDVSRRDRWRRGMIAVAFGHACSSTIKQAIGRQRPAVEDLPHLMATPTGLSFPSTHSATSFAAARAYSSLVPAAPLYALATAMALSRVYLGVHYPSDVTAGAAVGVVAGSAGR